MPAKAFDDNFTLNDVDPSTQLRHTDDQGTLLMVYKVSHDDLDAWKSQPYGEHLRVINRCDEPNNCALGVTNVFHWATWATLKAFDA